LGSILFLFFGIFYGASTQAFSNNSHFAPAIRVRILSDVQNLDIQTSAALQFNGKTANALGRVANIPSHLFWIHKSMIDGKTIWFVETNREKIRLSAPYLEVKAEGGRRETVNIMGHEIPLPLLLAPGKLGADVIAAVNLKDYLVRVLKAEMPASWPRQALKAQAVAARSYTLYQVRERRGKPWHLEGSVLDQAFWTRSASPIERIYEDVVAETEGEVLVSGSHLVKAYYHADCGGQTEDPRAVWGTGSDIQSVTDRSCPFGPHAHWHLSLSIKEMGQEIAEKFPTLGILQEIKVLSRTQTHRVALVALNGSQGRVTLTGQQLRQVLGFSRLKSSLFELKRAGAQVVFDGKGFGHGSGLCQWGARALAQAHKDFKMILNHYYGSGVRLARLKWHENPGI